jgi:hypothetical protein
MSIRAEVLDALLAAGATAEMIVAAVKADLYQDDIKQQEKREKDAARQRKSRTNRGMPRNVTVTPRDGCDTPPNDIYSNPPLPSEAKASALPIAEKVVEAWNAMATENGLPTARALNPGRRKHLAARIREHGEQAVFEAIEKLGKSDWHCGRKPGSDWKADLGWLLKSPESFQKMLERSDHPPPLLEPTDTLSHLGAKYRKAA